TTYGTPRCCSSALVSSAVFFFQAEDGIRDRNVTGVQTCALPIFPALEHDCAGRRGVAHVRAQEGLLVDEPAERGGRRGRSAAGRSEERRVGKECGWGGARWGGREE